MSAAERRKGARVEREIVELLEAIGIHAERYPYSGATAFRGKKHDLDVYLFGTHDMPASFEVKARASGTGFTMLNKWLGESDGLILKENNAKPKWLLSNDLMLEILGRLKHSWNLMLEMQAKLEKLEQEKDARDEASSVPPGPAAAAE